MSAVADNRERMRIVDVAGSLIRSSAFVFLATIAVHSIPLPVSLPIVSGDGSLYSALADRMLDGDWTGVVDPSRVLWTKAIFLAIVAGAKIVAPVSWPYLVVAANVACSAATATIVVRFIRRATGSVAAAWSGFVFCVASFDVVFTTRFIMADPLYTLLSTVVFVLVAGPVLEGQRPRSSAPLVASLLLAALTRPPGAALTVVAVTVVITLWPRRDGSRPSARLRRWAWATVLAVMVGGAGFRTYIVQDPQRWPFELIRPKIEEFADRESRDGEVVSGHRSTFREPPATYADHLVLQADRFARFFQFVSVDFSRPHNYANAAHFVPLYALACLAVAYGFRTTDRRRRDLTVLLLFWILVAAYVHALTILLWRYRVPLMPQLGILAALGVDALRVMLASRRTGTIAPIR